MCVLGCLLHGTDKCVTRVDHAPFTAAYSYCIPSIAFYHSFWVGLCWGGVCTAQVHAWDLGNTCCGSPNCVCHIDVLTTCRTQWLTPQHMVHMHRWWSIVDPLRLGLYGVV